MLKLALCDDRQWDLEKIQTLLAEYRQARPELELALFSYSSASALLDAGMMFDIFLLDILMPGLDGIELGRELRRTHPMAPILYLTSSGDFALESYRTEAMAYLLKPVDKGELFRALDRAAERCVRERARAIAVPVEDGMRRVFFSELVAAKAVGRTLLLHLADGSQFSSAGRKLNFAQLWAALQIDGRFLLLRRGCLVNMDLIDWLGEAELELTGGRRLPLPRGRRGAVRRCYLAYCNKRFGYGGELL